MEPVRVTLPHEVAAHLAQSVASSVSRSSRDPAAVDDQLQLSADSSRVADLDLAADVTEDPGNQATGGLLARRELPTHQDEPAHSPPSKGNRLDLQG